jgi:hypothetical protein
VPSFLPEPYAVAHVARAIDTGDVDPDTGNPPQTTPAPVIRWVRAISQEGHSRGSSHQVISSEFVKRIETELLLAVANPECYAPQDVVMLFPELDANGAYIPSSGIAFWVTGLARDDTLSPWPQFTKMFGGSVRIKRVT